VRNLIFKLFKRTTLHVLGMIAQQEEDSGTAGVRTQFAASKDINVYVNPNEKTSDGSGLEEEASKKIGAPVKRSVFRAYKNYSS
jgi:hypothetical protein